MEWSWIKRVEELGDGGEFDLDQDPAILLLIQ